MQWARFQPRRSILASQVLLLWRRDLDPFLPEAPGWVTDEQVALYLEEKEPSLQTMLVSAVESSREGRHWESSALVRRLIEQAVERCAQADTARRAEHGPLRLNGAVFGALVTAAVLAVLLGPAFFRDALSAMLLVSRSVEAAAPYKIAVTPGNVSVPKGADQTVTAKLQGFNAEEVVLMVRRVPGTPFEKQPLILNDKGNFEGILFGVKGATDYFVDADRVLSPVFTLKVVDVPHSASSLEYKFWVIPGSFGRRSRTAVTSPCCAART